jgi:hypothetical protein
MPDTVRRRSARTALAPLPPRSATQSVPSGARRQCRVGQRQCLPMSFSSESPGCRCAERGATGLEPATSGVTGVSKQLRPASSSRLNRVSIRIRAHSTRFPASRFFAWLHPAVSCRFQRGPPTPRGRRSPNVRSTPERAIAPSLPSRHGGERMQLDPAVGKWSCGFRRALVAVARTRVRPALLHECSTRRTEHRLMRTQLLLKRWRGARGGGDPRWGRRRPSVHQSQRLISPPGKAPKPRPSAPDLRLMR